MNIGIFTNNYLPNPYGVTESIETFRRELEKKGHRVFIFAPKWKGYKDENPEVFRYPAVNISFKFKFPLPIPYSRKMDKIIKNLDLDIIHAQHPNLLGSVAAKWAKKKNIPLVFTWHTLYDKYAHFAVIVPEKVAAKWMIGKAVKYANNCDQIIVPTESVKKIIQDWGVANKNMDIIPTGVEESFFQNPDRDSIRKKYNINDDETLLFLISRLTSEKNVEFLFQSVAEVLKSNKKVKFLVAGGGYLVPKLKNFISQNEIDKQVSFEGIIDRQEVKNYFAAGDIFVYASKSETQGMVITEAMYAGLPIVAVKATGIQDLVEDKVNGFLVSENNPSEIPQGGNPLGRSISQGKEFTEAINKLINDAELRKRMGAESARIAREKYTASVCAEKMLVVYRRAMENHE